MSVGAFPVVIFHDLVTQTEIDYMQKQVLRQVNKCTKHYITHLNFLLFFYFGTRYNFIEHILTFSNEIRFLDLVSMYTISLKWFGYSINRHYRACVQRKSALVPSKSASRRRMAKRHFMSFLMQILFDSIRWLMLS